jgi:hypothetical protein
MQVKYSSSFALFLTWFCILFTLCCHYADNATAAKKALLVGVGDYQNMPAVATNSGEYLDLKGPENDVRALKETLISQYGFMESDIKTLLDSQATRANINKAFTDWLVNETQEGDLALFYFSGHGATINDENGDESDGFDEALLPYDIDLTKGAPMIIDDEFGEWLRKLDNRKVVVLMDSCYSGGALRTVGVIPVQLESTPTSRAKFLNLSLFGLKKNNAIVNRGVSMDDIPKSVIFMSAAKEDERAIELPIANTYYGAFTFSILDGMKQSQNLSYQKISKHAQRYIRDELKAFQKPQLIASEKMMNNPFLGGKSISLSQKDNMPTSPCKTTTKKDNKPIAPLETSKKVRVAIDNLQDVSEDDKTRLKQELTRLNYIQLVEKEQIFDRLIRGQKINNAYEIRLINQIGDVEKIGAVNAIDELITKLKPYFEYDIMVKSLAKITPSNPSFEVELKVVDETTRDFKLGEKIVFSVKSEKDSYILLINLSKDGAINIIYPNKYHHDAHVKANEEIEIPDKAMKAKAFEFMLLPPAGEELVKVIATSEPLNFKGIKLVDEDKDFQIISGADRNAFIEEILQKLSTNQMDWNVDAVFFRSYD